LNAGIFLLQTTLKFNLIILSKLYNDLLKDLNFL